LNVKATRVPEVDEQGNYRVIQLVRGFGKRGRGNELILVAGKHAATQQVIMPNSAAGAIPGWRNEERDWE